MEALQLLDKIDNLQILFEPIYSADEHRIVAYEVLKGEDEDGEIIHFTHFIYDEAIPIEIRSEIEQVIARQAVQIILPHLEEIDIYLPCNPNILMLDYGEGYFNLLSEFLTEDQLKHVTLVLSEHKFDGDIKHLNHVVKYLKTYGIKFALNEIGAHSKLESLLALEPSVLKINVDQLNYSNWGNQHPVFTTLRTFAGRMGATLMVTNIDTTYEFQHAWKNGARYYKGPYLHAPSKDFLERDTLKERLKQECEQFILTEKKLIRQKFELEKKLTHVIQESIQQYNPTSANIESIMKLAKHIEDSAFRLYICDGEGFQLTPNIVQREGEWMIQEAARNKNWSWRPYFLQQLLKLREESLPVLSSSYSDIETEEPTRTFSIALPNNEYLFVDISYNYLYENNIVN